MIYTVTFNPSLDYIVSVPDFKLGFTNRGVKINKNLYFLNHTKAPAILVEVCFVDDRDDYMLYTSDRDAVAEAIVRAVVKHNKAYIV